MLTASRSKKRALLLMLHILCPYVLARLYSTGRRTLLARHESLQQAQIQTASLDELFATAPPPPPPKTLLQRLTDRVASMAPDLPTFETLTEDYLRSVHLAVFYLFGRYYHLSKRGAGIRFVRRFEQVLTRRARRLPSGYVYRSRLKLNDQRLCRAPRQVSRRLRLTRYWACSWPSRSLSARSWHFAEGARRPSSQLQQKQKLSRKKRNNLPNKNLRRRSQWMGDPSASSCLTQMIRSRLALTLMRKKAAARRVTGDAPFAWARAEIRLRLIVVMSVSRRLVAAQRALSLTVDDFTVCWECIVGWAREKASRGISRSRDGSADQSCSTG